MTVASGLWDAAGRAAAHCRPAGCRQAPAVGLHHVFITSDHIKLPGMLSD